MAFGVTATPDTLGTFNPGDSVDVTFTFTGVPAEVTGNNLVTFLLGSESVTVALAVTLDEPDPQVGDIVLLPGLTATVLSIDDTQAVIHFARS